MKILSMSLSKFNNLFNKYISLDYKLMGYINEGNNITDDVRLRRGVFMRPVFNSYSVTETIELPNYTQLIKFLYNYTGPSMINVLGETISINNNHIYYHGDLIGYFGFGHLTLLYHSIITKFYAKLCLPALKYGVEFSIVSPYRRLFRPLHNREYPLPDIDEEFINCAFNNIIYGDLEGLGQQESV